MAGTPSAYVLATVGMTIVSVLFFGVVGTLGAGLLFDIGFSIDPPRVGGAAAAISGVVAFVSTAVISYRDYNYVPSTDISKR